MWSWNLSHQGKAGLLVPWMVETFLGLVYDLVSLIIVIIIVITTTTNTILIAISDDELPIIIIIIVLLHSPSNQVQIIGTIVRLEALGAVFGILGFAVGCYIFVVVWSFRLSSSSSSSSSSLLSGPSGCHHHHHIIVNVMMFFQVGDGDFIHHWWCLLFMIWLEVVLSAKVIIFRKQLLEVNVENSKA